MKDQLFLLKPGFLDGAEAYFCADCATVEGMLSFYPALREKVDVTYVDFARPRAAIVALLGSEHQGAPCLVLADTNTVSRAPASVTFQKHEGRAYLDDAFDICTYLAAVHGGNPPHP